MPSRPATSSSGPAVAGFADRHRDLRSRPCRAARPARRRRWRRPRGPGRSPAVVIPASASAVIMPGTSVLKPWRPPAPKTTVFAPPTCGDQRLGLVQQRQHGPLERHGQRQPGPVRRRASPAGRAGRPRRTRSPRTPSSCRPRAGVGGAVQHRRQRVSDRRAEHGRPRWRGDDQVPFFAMFLSLSVPTAELAGAVGELGQARSWVDGDEVQSSCALGRVQHRVDGREPGRVDRAGRQAVCRYVL